MKVLFVCEGNVGRSQMAEAIFNKLTGNAHEVSSAGTYVIKGDDHSRVGKVLAETRGAENVLAVLNEIGVDASRAVRKPLTQALVEDAEKIVVMAGDDTIPEYLKTSSKAVFWHVTDPYDQSLKFTREIRDQIEKKLREYLKTL